MGFILLWEKFLLRVHCVSELQFEGGWKFLDLLWPSQKLQENFRIWNRICPWGCHPPKSRISLCKASLSLGQPVLVCQAKNRFFNNILTPLFELVDSSLKKTWGALWLCSQTHVLANSMQFWSQDFPHDSTLQWSSSPIFFCIHVVLDSQVLSPLLDPTSQVSLNNYILGHEWDIISQSRCKSCYEFLIHKSCHLLLRLGKRVFRWHAFMNTSSQKPCNIYTLVWAWFHPKMIIALQLRIIFSNRKLLKMVCQ